MTFTGLVIAHQDSSYDGKKGRVLQETLTCLDAELPVKLTDTVDCVFPAGTIHQTATLVGKAQAFLIETIHPSNTMRPLKGCPRPFPLYYKVPIPTLVMMSCVDFGISMRSFGVVLLIASIRGENDYVSLWYKHHEDFLAEGIDGKFDAFQIKTATPESIGR